MTIPLGRLRHCPTLRMAKPKWSIASLLLLTLCCAVAVAFFWRTESALAKQVRRDLNLSKSDQLYIVERHPDGLKDNEITELVVVIQNGQAYKLAFVYRDPTSSIENFQRWEIGFVMVSGLGR